MSQPQAQQRPSAPNGGVGGRRRNDKDVGARTEGSLRSDNQHWRQPARTSSNSSTPGLHHNHVTTGGPRSAGEGMGNRGGERAVHERLLFFHTCLIGQQVEVQTRSGHVYSGIFSSVSPEKEEFGVVLKMARLIKDGALKGAKGEQVREAARKHPHKQFIIYGKDFVQIIAKEVSLSGDALPNGRARENRAEMITDAVLSQGRLRELERELKPWKPDDDASENLNLNFTHTWRNWDQFETNKTLFGVETTFNEELYTTKLEKGPQMREREREAWRIAREIEGQPTRNVHLAEERGMRLTPEVEAMDEESRYSSVIRGDKDVGEDDEDRHIDDRNDETFGAPPTSSISGDSNASTPVAGEAENKSSRPSSADSAQTVNEASKLETLRDRRATSIEKGDVASLDSVNDPHREHLRLRHLLVGDKSKRANKGPGSPYHSPVGRGSPLMSPLIGDPTGIQALNLDPSCPQVPEEVYRCDGDLDVRREFQEFKLQETAKKGKKQREAEVNDLKLFSENLRKKELEPRSPRATPKSISGDFTREGAARPAASHDVKSSLAPPVPAAILITAQASAPPPSSLPLPTGLGAPAKQPSSIAQTSGVPPEAFGAVGVNSLGAGPSGAPVSGPPTPNFNAQASSPGAVNQGMVSPTLSRSSSSASLASATGSTKKSMLNPNAKEFKLNPNARVFTPNFSSPRPSSPVVQSPVYMHASLPPATPLQAVPVNLQYLQQQGQPSQFPQYNNAMVAAAVNAANVGTPYMQQSGSFVPGFPGGGVPPVLPGQPSMKMPPHSQQQVVGSYGQQQQLRYPPQPPMQPGTFIHPNSHMYPQAQMMYAQPGGHVMYIQPLPQQGMMQQQPVPPPPQGPLPPPQSSQQNQQQKHRSGGIQGMHYGGAPSFHIGQPHHLLQPQMPHLHNALPGGLAPAAMNPGSQPQQGIASNSGPAGQNGGNGTGRAGGKGAAGGFQQQ